MMAVAIAVTNTIMLMVIRHSNCEKATSTTMNQRFTDGGDIKKNDHRKKSKHEKYKYHRKQKKSNLMPGATN